VFAVNFVARNVARRRALVLKYWKQDWPIEIIATKLRVSERTVTRDLAFLRKQDPSVGRRHVEGAWARLPEEQIQAMEREPDAPAVQPAAQEPTPAATPPYTPPPFTPRRTLGQFGRRMGGW
jgi:hypothetical protein